MVRAWICAGLALMVVSAPLDAKSRKKEREAVAPVAADWRKTVTNSDMDRLRDWRTAFTKAVARARASGHGPSIEREGALLEPDSALDRATPPVGQYQCRVIKLGGKGVKMTDYVVYPAYPCEITGEGEVMGFAKSKGMQRPIGLFFPADERRMIFLGTMMLGDETRPMEYGRDSSRDMAGAFERIGAQRWRLILPWPRFESMLDVIELVPAPVLAPAKGS